MKKDTVELLLNSKDPEIVWLGALSQATTNEDKSLSFRLNMNFKLYIDSNPNVTNLQCIFDAFLIGKENIFPIILSNKDFEKNLDHYSSMVFDTILWKFIIINNEISSNHFVIENLTRLLNVFGNLNKQIFNEVVQCLNSNFEFNNLSISFDLNINNIDELRNIFFKFIDYSFSLTNFEISYGH